MSKTAFVHVFILEYFSNSIDIVFVIGYTVLRGSLYVGFVLRTRKMYKVLLKITQDR